MMFCSHCGKSAAEGARFCAACGKPIAPDAVAAVTVELRRHRKQMRLMVIVVGLVCVVAAGLIVSWVRSISSTVSRSLSGGATAAPILQRQQPLPEQPAAVQLRPARSSLQASLQASLRPSLPTRRAAPPLAELTPRRWRTPYPP